MKGKTPKSVLEDSASNVVMVRNELGLRIRCRQELTKADRARRSLWVKSSANRHGSPSGAESPGRKAMRGYGPASQLVKSLVGATQLGRKNKSKEAPAGAGGGSSN
ncbi:unnamed protein product, partial [Amoebophrya sp. A120]|eukprot:GSA120T00005299001.1